MSRRRNASRGGSERRESPAEHGSALVLAIFVLVVLAGMGTALLFLSHSEVEMSQAGLRAKQTFYLAEAGLEDGRTTLFLRNKNKNFTTELGIAAGLDGAINFDPANIAAVYDTNGNFTGFTGFGDDQPLATRAFGEGWYTVFMTNDPDEPSPGRLNLTDTNDRVLLTGVAAGPDRTFEIVQAIVEFDHIFPALPPATITMIGPQPAFDGGSSSAKFYTGDDCNGVGGIPGLFAPVVGAIGSSAAADPCPPSGDSVTCGMVKPGTFHTGFGTYTGYSTAADVTDPAVIGGMGPIAPDWHDCAFLQNLVEKVRDVADVVCTPPASCTFPPDSPHRVIFVDGDLSIGPTGGGSGLLFVTGELRFSGNADWHGMIYCVGEGVFIRLGAGNGPLTGALFVADIAGPDNAYGTNDDCGGPDNGFDVAVFDESGGGVGDEIFCTDDITPALPIERYKIVSFLQR